MNQETVKLIEQLANKLGTTSEYLWAVLLKQAPISSTITLIQFVLIAIFGVILYKSHKHLSNRDNEVSYRDSDASAVAMVIGFIIFVILCIAAFLCIEDVINGYFNREFWALEYILHHLK